MENSTDSANRTAATPYGRAYPPGLRPSAPSPTAPACAFGGAPLRGSPGFAGSPSRYRAWPIGQDWLTKGAASRAGGRSTACALIEHRGSSTAQKKQV